MPPSSANADTILQGSSGHNRDAAAARAAVLKYFGVDKPRRRARTIRGQRIDTWSSGSHYPATRPLGAGSYHPLRSRRGGNGWGVDWTYNLQVTRRDGLLRIYLIRRKNLLEKIFLCLYYILQGQLSLKSQGFKARTPESFLALVRDFRSHPWAKARPRVRFQTRRRSRASCYREVAL
jgi:hypothetical protein